MFTPPDLAGLPRTLISAELLHGTLLRCGPGVRGVGWPDTPSTRSAALHATHNIEGLIGVLATAAWLWGAVERPADPLTFSTLGGSRYLRAPTAGIRVHEYLINRRDIVRVGPCWITSRRRTLYDLLYLDEHAYETTGFDTARLLMETLDEVSPTVVTEFHTRNRPHSVRAAARLAELSALIR